ncbi:MAG: hypothetical protein GC200_01495 [Tepidisphaera sp.]|nr:hypothetical protein [Tepidisphaera sp.]
MRHAMMIIREVCLVSVAAAACFSLGACASQAPRRDPQTISPTPTRDPVEGRLTFEPPIDIPNTTSVMVPFAITSERGFFEANDQFRRPAVSGPTRAALVSVSSDLRPSLMNVRWHNVIFRNLQSGEERTLLDQRGVVSGYTMCSSSVPIEGGRWMDSARALVFLVTTRDTNRNGALDAGDAQVLMMTGPNGENAHAITPDGMAVTNVRYQAAAGQLLIELRADTNDDGVIDYNDEPSQWVCGLSDGMANPLISKPTAEHVRSLLK